MSQFHSWEKNLRGQENDVRSRCLLINNNDSYGISRSRYTKLFGNFPPLFSDMFSLIYCGRKIIFESNIKTVCSHSWLLFNLELTGQVAPRLKGYSFSWTALTCCFNLIFPSWIDAICWFKFHLSAKLVSQLLHL